MRAMLMYLFPGLLRLEKEKQTFEKYIPLFLITMAGLYFGYHFLWKTEILWFAAMTAAEKALILYFTFLLLEELSPDAKQSYIAGFVAIAASLFVVHDEPLIPTLFFLLNTRILTKSSGYLTTRWELFFMMMLTVILSVISPFIFPLLFGITLCLDYFFKHKDSRNLPFALVSIGISFLWFKNGFGIMTKELDPFGSIAVFVISLLYIFRLSILKHILSFNDTKTNIVSPKRVKSAGILMLISLTVIAIGHGEFYEFFHLWVMLLCISIPYIKDMGKLFFAKSR